MFDRPAPPSSSHRRRALLGSNGRDAREDPGTVGLSCVVDVDGRVRDCRLTRSLDARYGLDVEAIRAAQRWQFEPGRRGNAPVAVRVAIEMAFTVR